MCEKVRENDMLLPLFSPVFSPPLSSPLFSPLLPSPLSLSPPLSPLLPSPLLPSPLSSSSLFSPLLPSPPCLTSLFSPFPLPDLLHSQVNGSQSMPTLTPREAASNSVYSETTLMVTGACGHEGTLVRQQNALFFPMHLPVYRAAGQG